jgi:hypothetical protein
MIRWGFSMPKPPLRGEYIAAENRRNRIVVIGHFEPRGSKFSPTFVKEAEHNSLDDCDDDDDEDVVVRRGGERENEKLTNFS